VCAGIFRRTGSADRSTTVSTLSAGQQPILGGRPDLKLVVDNDRSKTAPYFLAPGRQPPDVANIDLIRD
jgi:hypothetical protein